MPRASLVLVLLLSLAATAGAAGPAAVEFVPPEFLAGPAIERSMLGVTYAYHARDVAAATALQVSIVKLPRGMKTADAPVAHCISLFTTAVAKSYAAFFAVQSDAALATATLDLTQVRWTARDRRRAVTGVTSCAVDRDRYISINFQDSIENAPTSFPLLRASIGRMRIRY